MQKNTLSVLFACFLGAFVGALCALEISERFTYGSYFWGIGALFGGFVAYIAVDFRQLCSGVARSYRESKRNLATVWSKIVSWKPDSMYWKAVTATVVGDSLASVSFFGVAHVANEMGMRASNEFILVSIGMLILLAFLAIFVLFTHIVITLHECHSSQRCYSRDETLRLAVENGWKILKIGNPVSFPFVLMWLTVGVTYEVISGIIASLWCNRIRIYITLKTSSLWLIRNGLNLIKVVAIEAKQFVVKSFVYVHSDRRTLCFVDATIGATAGYFLGSSIAGAVIGAILGVVNFEFVSVRWLKLVPIKKN